MTTKHDPHSKPLDTINAKASISILLMLFRHYNGPSAEIVDATIRAVRKRWDQLAPPNITDRKLLPADLVKERAAWDNWMTRFLNWSATIVELEEMIGRCNAASRVGVTCDKVPSILASLKIGTPAAEIVKISTNPNQKEIDDIEAQRRALDERLAKITPKTKQIAPTVPDLPAPPAPSADEDVAAPFHERADG